MKHVITFHVAGVTFENRQGYLRHIERCPNVQLTLYREKNNKFDPNAIKVMVHANNKRFPVGYVPRQLAAELAPLMDTNIYIRIENFKVTGGYGRPRGLEVNIRYYT